MTNLILLLTFMLPTLMAVSAADVVKLDEDLIYKLLSERPPTTQSIEASFLTTDLARAQANDIYAATLGVSANILDSDEKSLNSFIPITSKYKAMTVSINKPLQYGAVLNGKIFTQKSTNNVLSDATTTGYGLSLSLDLYRDILGRTSKANIDMAENSSKRSRLEKEIQIASFKNNLRKLYWALVANQEGLKITKILLSSSEKQLRDANKRFKSGIADKGELARYRSQISSRKARLISLQWEKSQLKKQIKLLLPKISESEITLAPYDIDKTVETVLACSLQVQKYSDAPMDFTKYDEIAGFLKREEISKSKIVNNYDSMDLKLIGEYESTGKAFSQSNSFRDLSEDGRASLSIGLQFSMPLGSTKKETRKIYNAINKKSYLAQKRNALGKVNSYHSQTIKSVGLLNQIISNQKENTKHLSQSLKVSKRKYSQARITAQQLVQEQDAFFQSNLDEISTKLAIIGLLMDYFNVFTDMPCELNRKL